MTDIAGRYPLSSADKQAIPLDIIRPEGIVRLALTRDVATSSITLPAVVDCFSFISDVDCFVQFAAIANTLVAPVSGTYYGDVLYVPKNTAIIVSPPIDKRVVSVISVEASGSLVVQALQTWSGLALSSQFNRR